MNAIDTNVLVYAFDLDAKVKGVRALELLHAASPDDTILLWQVACELGAVLTRIGPRALQVRDRQLAIESVRARMALAMPSPEVLDSAWKLRDSYQLSFWDALLVAACREAGVNRLYTEDLQSRPEIEGVTIVNPFM